jgi:signal transduction histidine kinase
MTSLLRGKPGGLAAFLIISSLVAGGLGWATRAALGLEREQLDQAARAEQADPLRLALWRLDSRITAFLAREESRPFNHYSAVFAPPLVLDGLGHSCPPGTIVEPSPLLDAELPPWMLLHFQTDSSGWESPQVLSRTLDARLRSPSARVALTNVTEARKRLLTEVGREMPSRLLLVQAREHAGETTIRDRVLVAQRQAGETLTGNKVNPTTDEQNWREYVSRSGSQSKLGSRFPVRQVMEKSVALGNTCRNGEEWLNNSFALVPSKQKDAPATGLGLATPASSQPSGGPAMGLPSPQVAGGLGGFSPQLDQQVVVVPQPRRTPGAEVVVSMSPMVGLWLRTSPGRHRLMAIRLVRLQEKEVCQGILLDADKLGELLADEVRDLFPAARVLPARDPTDEQLQQSMTALPLYLDTGAPLVPGDPGWTPLRVGLSLAWAAALVALVAVGLGGFSLLRLSERRIRFVSAVTHELRTPLTTLQLYLDMLLGGLVREEKQRTEYLQTLHAETDRLSRLVANVLDFSRLENRSPEVKMSRVAVSDVLEQVRSAWSMRCEVVGKELHLENGCPPEEALQTDPGLLQQVLGNLLDNACKYSREAEDKRIWLRATRNGGRVALEVEDRGPGIPPGERRAIFRTFRRGRGSDTTTGGVGLGLALGRRWTRLLGGRLSLGCPAEGGACFRVELPTG